MKVDSQRVEDRLAAGNEALRAGAWEDARGHFEAALGAGESAEALEGLGWVGWWLSDADLAMGSRERAQRAYRVRGEAGAAARVAAWLAADFREFRGEMAAGRGWLERARRMIDGLPKSADHGWVVLTEGDFALIEGDVREAAQRAAAAAQIGREFEVADLEAVGLAMEGVARVAQGEVERGMRLLDEASAVAVTENIELPVSTGWALCYLISACEGIGDFARAGEWCGAMREHAERWGARQLLGVCRSSYGRVLATAGDWAAAESELTAAVSDLQAARPGMAAGGQVRLAELRVRQGREQEAHELFERATPHPLALVGLGRLALDEGDPNAAVDAAERVLRRVPEESILERLPALELLVRGRALLGEWPAAHAAQEELERTAGQFGTAYLRGRARLTAGELCLAEGGHEQARQACEDAVDCFREGSAPYETALARLELARALGALGRDQHAAAEARGAREGFAALGAVRDVERAEALLRGEDATTGAGAESLSELTPRELEVLRLVARGLSDAAIAEQLVLSPHTVHRHVANVRLKLRLPSRSAAVAYAARAGLL